MQQEVRTITSVDLRVTTNDKQDLFGAIGTTGDERIFRYAQVGASSVPSGTVVSAPATGANYLSLSVAAAAPIGATSIQVTLSGSSMTLDQLLEGNVDVISGTGSGISYKAKGNALQTSTTGVVTIYLLEPIIVALDTTSKVNLSPNIWQGLTSQIALGSAQDNPKIAGVTSASFTANQYGWVQVEGRCMTISDGTSTMYRGLTCVLSTSTAGRVQLTSGTADADKQVIGNILEHGAATNGLLVPVYLTIF